MLEATEKREREIDEKCIRGSTRIIAVPYEK